MYVCVCIYIYIYIYIYTYTCYIIHQMIQKNIDIYKELATKIAEHQRIDAFKL